jgi:methyl-accepting chemotaxis protein
MSRQMDVVQKMAHTFSKEFHQLVNSVESINRLSSQLNNAVENSNQYIAKTDEITNSVNKIAMQTKILGLNANIEAARAGEHGKGFAVVANEVQKLSDNTTQFATEISELLKELSNEIQLVNDAANQLNVVSQTQNGTANIMETAINELGTIL